MKCPKANNHKLYTYNWVKKVVTFASLANQKPSTEAMSDLVTPQSTLASESKP